MQELVTSLFLILLGALLSFTEKKKENLKEKKSNRYNFLSFMLIIIGCIIGFWNGYSSILNKQIDDKKIDSVNNILTTKQNTIDSITKVLVNRQDRIMKIQDMNYDTAKAILSQSISLNKS